MRHKQTRGFLKMIANTAVGVVLLVLLTFGTACKPGQFLERNACELLNCDVLFFIDDLFPLATQPSSGGGAGSGGEAAEPEEEEGGGHLH